jgi:Zn-dependent M28 family amino/carboxypeptidase
MLNRKIGAGMALVVGLAAMASAAAAQAPDVEEKFITAKEEQTAKRLIEKGLKDDTAWTLLESLTTQIGPRLAGSEAEARARDWGVQTLERLGFKNVRIETFELTYWNRISERAEIVSPFPQKLIVTALGHSPSTPLGGVVGEVVRFETLDALETSGADLSGKIIFVDEPMTRTQDGSGYGAAVQKRSRAAIVAAEKGAIAALIRSVGTDSHRNPHTGGSVRGGAALAPAPTAALSNPDADQLARALKLAKGPVRVLVDIQTEFKETAVSGNVIGEIPGKSDELIVVGGHLDSWDLGTGAIDDGAGVAITVAAAKLVGDLKGKPARTIRVIMWGAEETGLWGARAYAKAHEEELARHVLAAESDFGAARIWKFQTRFGEEAQAKAKVFQRLLHPLGVGAGNNQAFGGPDVSPLRNAGVPVVDLYQDGSDYFDLHHTPDDTLDKVDPDAVQQNVAAWAATIYLASQMDGGFRDEAD